MTSRIQEDGDGKEAKWADIDDDEEDWAPTTIEWNDGTKSSVLASEIPKVLEAASTPSVDASGEQIQMVQPARIIPPQFTSTVGPNATVLRIGANAEKQQAQRLTPQLSKGLVERPPVPTSRTNPAPAPAKSPWATLPPVEKVSPVVINPQVMAPPPQYPGNFSYQPNPSMAQVTSPAKEISADDFSRAWRDAPASHARELFMPNSGRYEAVPENRRRMSKTDGYRSTQVLQRPNHTDSHAPAEPSAAFQTTRSSADQVRRRASSTISGGSGQFGRRMSVSKSMDTSAIAVESPLLAQSVIAEPDASTIHPQAYQAAGNSNTEPHQEQIVGDDHDRTRAQQKLLMRERIEQARRRKQEEEAKEEALRQERIRLKLASLGPPPEQPRDTKTDAVSESDPSPQAAIHMATQSPPKPPLPLPTGEPQQYGMMKVHALDSLKKHNLPTHAPANEELIRTSPGLQPPTPVLSDTSSLLPDSIRYDPNTLLSEAPAPSSEPGRSPQPPKGTLVPSDARSGWADIKNNRAIQSGNLWGSSNSALGMGTFDQTLAGFTPQDLSRGTPFPNNGWPNGKSVPERSPQLPVASSQLQENRHAMQMTPVPSDQYSLTANSEIDSVQPSSRPIPIGSRQAPQTSSWQGSPRLQQQQQVGGAAAWNNFHQFASQQDRAENEKNQREAAARKEEELLTGVRARPNYTFNETWKQVHLGDEAGQRQVASVTNAAKPPTSMFGAVGTSSLVDQTQQPANNVPSRGSRFFPQQPENLPSHGRRAVTHSHFERSSSPSPPPAEEYASLHPAFDGNMKNPVVHFPREKVVVKLPPLSTLPVEPSEPSGPVSWAAMASQSPATPSLRAVSTPIAQTASWQDRFNGLLRKGSPPKSMAQYVHPGLTVASKEAFDVFPDMPLAAVSMPEAEAPIDPEMPASKDVEDEEDLFEDREAGSLPSVSIPRQSVPLMPRGVSYGYPAQFLRPSAPADAISIKPFMVSNWFAQPRKVYNDLFALVRLPGSTKVAKCTISSSPSSQQQAGKFQHVKSENSGKGNDGKPKSAHARQTSDPRQKAVTSNPASTPSSQAQSRGKRSATSTQPASPMPTAAAVIASSPASGDQHSEPTTSANTTPPGKASRGARNFSNNHGLQGSLRGRHGHHGHGHNHHRAQLQPQAAEAH